MSAILNLLHHLLTWLRKLLQKWIPWPWKPMARHQIYYHNPTRTGDMTIGVIQGTNHRSSWIYSPLCYNVLLSNGFYDLIICLHHKSKISEEKSSHLAHQIRRMCHFSKFNSHFGFWRPYWIWGKNRDGPKFYFKEYGLSDQNPLRKSWPQKTGTSH